MGKTGGAGKETERYRSGVRQDATITMSGNQQRTRFKDGRGYGHELSL
jgi:hypothetical protein